jgi:hypothetical protein
MVEDVIRKPPYAPYDMRVGGPFSRVEFNRVLEGPAGPGLWHIQKRLEKHFARHHDAYSGETLSNRRRAVADILVKLKLLGGAALEMNKLSSLGEDSLGVLERILTLAMQALDLKRVAILTADDGSRDLTVRSAIGYGAVTGKVIPAPRARASAARSSSRAGRRSWATSPRIRATCPASRAGARRWPRRSSSTTG